MTEGSVFALDPAPSELLTAVEKTYKEPTFQAVLLDSHNFIHSTDTKSSVYGQGNPQDLV